MADSTGVQHKQGNDTGSQGMGKKKKKREKMPAKESSISDTFWKKSFLKIREVTKTRSERMHKWFSPPSLERTGRVGGMLVQCLPLNNDTKCNGQWS